MYLINFNKYLYWIGFYKKIFDPPLSFEKLNNK